MPSAQVEFHHRDKSFYWVFDFCHRQQQFGMCHEAMNSQYSLFRSPLASSRLYTHFVILSNMLRGSKMKVGSTTRLKSAPGRNWEMMCDRTIQFGQLFSLLPHLYKISYHFLDLARQRLSRPPAHRIAATHRRRTGCLYSQERMSNLSL
jgi:hypothetical protein